ncbi:MAG: hypothetical protein FJ286_05780 [Planctomycetes bacterium]|nr:hypothetical protein [Planctomycetota bacterium]
MTRRDSRPSDGWLIGTLRSASDPVGRWVVKFGGSLLTRRHWPHELGELVARLPGAVTVVVGGGPLVDGLRTVDAASPRPAELMHALAIEALRITARLAADATELPLLVEPAAAGARGVLDPCTWLAERERTVFLPAGWHVTSDSIAAAVAREALAGLMLAKRRPPPVTGLEELVAAGWIDPYLPVVAEPVVAIDWAVPADAG